MKSSTDQAKGGRALLASALAFSLMTVCVKKLDGQLPIPEILLVRSIISLAFTQYLLKAAGISPWGRNKRLLVLRGLLGTGALICVFYALMKLPLSSATVIQYTYPTFTTITAWLILGEKVRRRIFLAVLLGWAGITLVVKPAWIGMEINSLPILPTYVGLLGALLTALAYTCVRKLSQQEHQLVIVYYFPLISIPITIPFVLKQGVLPVGMEWIWLLGIGIFTQLGQLWITKGLTLLPAARASSVNYVQVVFATIWGFMLFNEPVDEWMILGSIFVFGATLVSLSGKDLSNKDRYKFKGN